MNSHFRLLRPCVAMMVAAIITAVSVPSFAYYTQSKSAPLIDGLYPEYPKTAPATGNKQKLIKRGEYLTKMGDCIACHTDAKNGGAAFSGGLAIETPFGTFYSQNITPDKETGIGKWTADDFIRAMHEGKSPSGQNYFPVFPYLYFQKTSKNDLRAMFAYLQSIPAVNKKNKPQGFPFNLPGARMSLLGWNLLFFYPEKGQFQYDSSKSNEWNRGKYIVDGLGHCSMCHTPLNVLGSPKREYYLAGAFIDGFWAPNITKYGLRSASRYEVADVFKKGELINQAGPVAGPMAEVNHDSLQYLTEKDRLAIATYLKTVVSKEYLGVKPSERPPNVKRGRQVYFSACHICHEKGVMGAPVIGDSASWFRRVKEQGKTGLVRHSINGYNSMPVKGACVTCSDNDIISAIDYILQKSLERSQWVDLKQGETSKAIDNGEDVYKENCALCHDKGVNAAPKLGDTQVWKHLIKKNMDVLIQNTLDGVHPKNGGCKHCKTREIIAAIKYMVNKSNVGGNYNLW